MYFRYPSPSANEGDQRSVSHQLVQCVYKKTSYPSPIQVQHLCFPKTIKDHPEVFVPFSTVISTGMIFYFVIFFQLLKGVGTKCWAPDAEYALHSVYQGGLFELRAGDEIFVSVSSPTMVNAEESASYFGAFRLDLWEERIGEKKKKRWDNGWINRWAGELGAFWISTDWGEKNGPIDRRGNGGLDRQCLLGQMHWRMEELGFERSTWVKNTARG